MINDELIHQVLLEFGFPPTGDQAHALDVFADFMFSRQPRSVMVMRGSAGTGKTSLAGAIVRTLGRLERKTLLLAPTGRAAKVFSLNSGHEAFTIHRKIYRERSFDGPLGQFNLNYNQNRGTLIIVDEASMLSNGAHDGTAFGSGRLLDDLIQYAYSAEGCRLMLIGDTAQLPPVGEQGSPALQAEMLSAYGLEVFECDLDEVLRQQIKSGILWNATLVRRIVERGEADGLPQLKFEGFADIQVVQGEELIEALDNSYSEVGEDETIVVTRSNKRANAYNQGIRRSVLWREEELSRGDMLMVVRNNYYWAEEQKLKLSFIANGDRCRVERIRNERELYGFRFADATLSLPDYDGQELDATIILDSLTTEAPALTREQDEQLYNKVLEDYADVPLKRDRQQKMRQDQYLNALQVKFGYAVTCHKAQGGQWAHVYVDQGYMTDEMYNEDYYHWLYTAFTRATEKLYLVNWPSALKGQ